VLAHDAEMNFRHVFADDTESKKLCTRKQRDDRSNKRKAGNVLRLDKVNNTNIDESSDAGEREEKSDETGDSQRNRGKASECIECVTESLTSE